MVAGGVLYRVVQAILDRKKPAVLADVPERLFKVATAAELAEFEKTGRIESELDRTDGFVHLSDRTSPPKVAELFFSDCKDLHLIELKASSLAGPVEWQVAPVNSTPTVGRRPTTVHYDFSCGCVHVYGAPVSMAANVRISKCPLGADGKHRMPTWL